ncbi:hypothetical protein [Paludibaculum fermentans]|uniref:Uncharacterized protein n=1 Tax=Paludibaculum fermentans TaxID=1473598 RepID=A0A7S7NWV6_PALFE|nr:hypothetical protein [Paludibaculum fermentans]QOY91273.1 hypothetical protein IRI77_15390 [Paludibaculum fermentans]
MAVVDLNNLVMTRPVVIGPTEIDLHLGHAVQLKSARIRAEADVTLMDGIPGSFTGSWKFGFIQLEYSETNYARYRGRQQSHGSTLSTSTRRFLVRDTDETAPDIWYDPPSGGVVEGRGTQVLRTTTPIPSAGRLTTHVMMEDRPTQPFSTRITNGSTGFFNFLHHMESTFMFCTILAAQEPGGRFHFLKHFYWNLDFEGFFDQDLTGRIRLSRVVRRGVNLQGALHSGAPRDPRFHGRELDQSLRIANNFGTRDVFSRTWDGPAA